MPATPVFEVIGKDRVSPPLNDTFPALVAVGVFGRVGWNVADIHIVHPFGHCHGMGFFESFDGGRCQAVEFVQGDKAAQVEGRI